MTDRNPHSTQQTTAPASADALPEVVLELRQGIARSATFPMSHVDFLIGTVPGCDLRVPGSELPAVLCLLARRPGGLALRKLAPTQIILVNGKTSTHADLNDGDRISVGATDIFVRLTKAAIAPPQARPVSRGSIPSHNPELADFEERLARFEHEKNVFAEDQRQRRSELQKAEALLKEREARLQAQAAEFDQDRTFWMQRRHKEEPAVELPSPDLMQREEKLSLREAELQDQLADLQRQRQEVANVRQELADIRKQLYDRYQERRDRLSGLQEAVDKAGRKVQERKRIVDAEEEELRQRSIQLDQQGIQIEEETRQLDENRRSFQERHDRLTRELTDKQTDLQTREHRLAADRLELEGMVKHYQADVLRLDRQNDDLQERDRNLNARDQELERRQVQLEQTSAELEQHAQELEDWRRKLTQDEARLAQMHAEQESRAEQQILRETSIEAQEANLTALRTRLERQRDELQAHEEQLDEQRERQERTATELEQDRQEFAALEEKLRLRGNELDAQENSIRSQTQRYQADSAVLKKRQEEWNQYHQDALEELNVRKQQAEEKENALAEQSRQQDKREAEQLANAEAQRRQGELLEESAQQVADQRQRLAQEREQFLLEQQQARQEHEQTQALFVEMRLQAESFVEELPEIELRAGTTLERLAHAREQLRDHLSEISAYVRQCQEDTERDSHKIQEKERVLRQHQDEHRLALVSFRQQLIDWQGQVAETKRSAVASGEGDKAKKGEGEKVRVEDLEKAKKDDGDKGREEPEKPKKTEREKAPERRPDLSQLADVFKTTVVSPGLPAPKAPGVSTITPPPASARPQVPTANPQAEAPKRPAATVRPQPEPEVCSWYRNKFRELSGVNGDDARSTGGSTVAGGPSAPREPGEGDDGDAPLIPIRRDILSLTDPADPNDRQLAESLRRLKLIDVDTLQALLVETRRQRRPLRQVLLAGGAVTLFQLAHIEAGDIDGLMVGPVRVVDRIRANSQEIVYQVFDPRRNQEAILRHLTQEQMKIAGRADEFRTSFHQALSLSRDSDAASESGLPHLAQTLEVLEISGRPAVLQESLGGLSSADWPPLVSVPGVCFRVLLQAVQGLDVAHHAGIVHGHINENLIMLLPDGIVKLCGVGEPSWLTEEQPAAKGPASAIQDLLSLGQVVSKWCTPVGVRRGAKTKPPPDALVALVARLAGTEANAGYKRTADVLNDLEKIRTDIPANPEAWDRLLRHVREHAAPPLPPAREKKTLKKITA